MCNSVKLTNNIKIIEGNVLDKHYLEISNTKEVILQQVNCKGVIGKGLAKQIKEDISDEDFNKYKLLCKTHGNKLLSKILVMQSKKYRNRKYIYIFAQDDYGYGKCFTDYKALEQALTKISTLKKDVVIAIPYNLGCELAGGDWNVVYKLICKTLAKNIVNIYRLSSSDSKKEPSSTKCGTNDGSVHERKVNMKNIGLENLLKDKKIYLAELTRKDFKDNPEILKKYFVNNSGYTIDRFHIPEGISKKEIAEDLCIKEKNISTLGYCHYEEFYDEPNILMTADFMDSVLENLSNDTENLDRNKSANKLYIEEDPKTSVVDKALFDELYKFCIKSIKLRLVMILGIEQMISELVNIEQYTYGFTENCTEFQAKSLRKMKKDLIAKLLNKSLKEFIKTNNDITVFANSDLNRTDYIKTYQTILRKFSDIRDTSLEYMRDIIDNKNDFLEDEIISNDLTETISYLENDDLDDYTDEDLLVICD